jgi:predicted helicase
MKRALAFCQNIKVSKQITNVFNTQKDVYYNTLTPEERVEVVTVESDHIDGSMGASTRDEKLSWLKSVPEDKNDCRILTNVRCLSEGVDVPTLDAVMFLSARNSQIDVVQSVGRVMRTAPDKKYGYIIIPVLIPSNVKPEDALDDNDRFRVVWTVLNALRAHDDRFNATINKLELNKKKPNGKSGGGTVLVGGVPRATGDDGKDNEATKALQQQFMLQFDDLKSVIYARMVQKVGDKRYWEQWAASVGEIAQRHIERIKKIVSNGGGHRHTFDDFIEGLRKNINPSITEDDAIEMLAQHLITRPVFEALFENYSFVKNNPISVSMQKMLDVLEDSALEKDQTILDRFYESVKTRASGIDNAEGRQKIIVELYDKFFRTAFPKVVEKLGIVYTPVEVVDFIIHSVEDVLQKEFGRSISDENIHILDPFTGTGTFITRLLQSGLIRNKDLVRKYEKEIHANEIVLLAYYIASINIENVFHDIIEEKNKYTSFEGICLTDTFQLAENDNSLLEKMFPENSKRITAQKKAPLKVIIGNPPYSVGQESANDNAKNQSYPKVESRIEDTYTKESKSVLSKSLYDSYIKAFRWASDRISDNGGVIGFVTNGSWIDGNALDGFRKCLESEFSTIYVFNLRGNCRTQGELRRKEGGNIFGLGSRTPISITILVKKPVNDEKNSIIYYQDIGDYLSRDDKLKQLTQYQKVTNSEIEWDILSPNQHGDWINKRDEVFANYVPIETTKKFNLASKSFYIVHAIGIATNRDSWVYGYNSNHVNKRMNECVVFYNNQLELYNSKLEGRKEIEIDSILITDPSKISWTRGLRKDIENNKKHVFNSNTVRLAAYRPFCKQILYYDRNFIESVGLSERFLPTDNTDNLIICCSGLAATRSFSVLITDCLPDLHFNGDSQCFPLYYYEEPNDSQTNLFDEHTDKYVRRDAITDFIYHRAREIYGPKVSKEDIFYYVYGFLHSSDYRTQYSSDLKKMQLNRPGFTGGSFT